jgi:hypothetical protein
MSQGMNSCAAAGRNFISATAMNQGTTFSRAEKSFLLPFLPSRL